MGISPWVTEIPSGLGLPGRAVEALPKITFSGWNSYWRGKAACCWSTQYWVLWHFFPQFQGSPQTGLKVVGSFKLLRGKVPPHRQLSSWLLPSSPCCCHLRKGEDKYPPSICLLKIPTRSCTGGTWPAASRAHAFSIGISLERMWTTPDPAFLLLDLVKDLGQKRGKEAYKALRAIGML